MFWFYVEKIFEYVHFFYSFLIDLIRRYNNNEKNNKNFSNIKKKIKKGKNPNVSYFNMKKGFKSQKKQNKDKITVIDAETSEKYEIDKDELFFVPFQNSNKYLRKNIDDFYLHILNRFETMIKEEMDKTHAFFYNNQIFGLTRKKMKPSLEKILSFFVDKEMYEEAERTKKLFDKIN